MAKDWEGATLPGDDMVLFVDGLTEEDKKKIAAEAKEELRQEDYRKAVDQKKQVLRERRSIRNRLFPFKITFKIERI